MAYDTGRMDADAVAHQERLAGLRVFVETMALHTLSRPMPKTFLEAERAVREVTVADRFLQAVPAEAGKGEEKDPSGATTRATSPRGGEEKADAPSTPSGSPSPRTEVPAVAGEDKRPEPGASPVRDPYRLKLRAHADAVMHAAATEIDKPESYLEAWRAQRYAWAAKAMLTQLYVPPAVKPVRYDPEDDIDLDENGRGRTLHDELVAIMNHPKAHIFHRQMQRMREQSARYEEAVRKGLNPEPLPPHPDDEDPELRAYLVRLIEYKIALNEQGEARHGAWQERQAAEAATRADEHPPP